MTIKRLKKNTINIKNEKKFKGKQISELTPHEKEELLEIIAKKLKLI